MYYQQSCTVPGSGSGVCLDTKKCVGQSYRGYCPGAANIQCCLSACKVGGATGACMDINNCMGKTYPGYCPGSGRIQCCIPGSAQSSSNYFVKSTGQTSQNGWPASESSREINLSNKKIVMTSGKSSNTSAEVEPQLSEILITKRLIIKNYGNKKPILNEDDMNVFNNSYSSAPPKKSCFYLQLNAIKSYDDIYINNNDYFILIRYIKTNKLCGFMIIKNKTDRFEFWNVCRMNISNDKEKDVIFEALESIIKIFFIKNNKKYFYLKMLHKNNKAKKMYERLGFKNSNIIDDEFVHMKLSYDQYYKKNI